MKTTIVAHGTEFPELLTLEAAKQLKGTLIRFTSPEYHANHQTAKEAVVGDIKLEHMLWGNTDPAYHKRKAKEQPREYFEKLVLLDEDGKIIGFTYTDDGVFYGSDEGRVITYEEMS